VKAPWWWS